MSRSRTRRWRAIGAALDAYNDPAALAALSVMTTLSGSALLALAVARGFLTPEAAWRAAHVDEDLRSSAGASTRRPWRGARPRREFDAAGVVLEAMRAT